MVLKYDSIHSKRIVQIKGRSESGRIDRSGNRKRSAGKNEPTIN